MYSHEFAYTSPRVGQGIVNVEQFRIRVEWPGFAVFSCSIPSFITQEGVNGVELHPYLTELRSFLLSPAATIIN